MEIEIELEAVLQFLRKNGFSQCESALIEDVMEKSHLDSSDFQKFIFPMVPPPPQLKIQPNRHPIQVTDAGGGWSSKGSSLSDDEFISLGSSSTELCSSEFRNPYGIQTSRTPSQSSSDRMSQFGTARDYHDFDMQNDLFWYREKDEDYVMPPMFDGIEFDNSPSEEDKYIMTVLSGKSIKNQSEYLKNQFSDENIKRIAYRDNFELIENLHLDKSETQPDECHNAYGCSAALCACCCSSERIYACDPPSDCKANLANSKMGNVSEHPLKPVGKSHSETEANFPSESNSEHELVNDNKIDGDPYKCESVENKEGDATSSDLLNESKEDDFEIFELRIIHRKNRTGFEENKELPIVINSIIAGRYYVTEFLGSAAFSRVIQAHDLYTGMDVCLKIIKNDKDFFDQSLDEIKLLKYVNKHDPADKNHIIRLYDYFYHQEHLFIVTELLRANLYEFQKYSCESGGEPYFTMHRLQAITRQCLEALVYLHDLGIIHCDLKPENILIKSYRKCEVKVIDLGSSCFEMDNLSLYVQSRSYRAPEVMLGLPYNQKIDLWSIGCILAELYSGDVLFPNETVALLLERIIGLLGPIDKDMLLKGQDTHKYFTEEYDLFNVTEDTNEVEYIIPEESSLEHHLQIYDPVFADFLNYILQINPKKRPTAREALSHAWLSYLYEVDSC